MEDYIGKICPFCKTEIKVGDEVKICSDCGIPHHLNCWTENRGCTTFGCGQQNYEPQGTNPVDVCTKCGSVLGEGQVFCPKCGTPKGVKLPVVCSKCGAELAEGHVFCTKCGQRADIAMDTGVHSAISEFNANVTIANKKRHRKSLIIGIVAVAVVIVLIIVIKTFTGESKDFNKMYSDISSESWCQIGSDGSYMRLDTNPYDLEDAYEMDAYRKIKEVNKELGLPESVLDDMEHTTALDGKQTAETDKITVSWRYHPDNGLEVTYTWK